MQDLIADMDLDIPTLCKLADTMSCGHFMQYLKHRRIRYKSRQSRKGRRVTVRVFEHDLSFVFKRGQLLKIK